MRLVCIALECCMQSCSNAKLLKTAQKVIKFTSRGRMFIFIRMFLHSLIDS